MNRPILKLVENRERVYVPELSLEDRIPIEPWPQITEQILETEKGKARWQGFVSGFIAFPLCFGIGLFAFYIAASISTLMNMGWGL